MKERKFKNDWINEVRWDEKTGQEKRIPVYRGTWFEVPGGSAARQHHLLPACLSWVGCTGGILLYFLLDFTGATTLFVFLPAALALFPAFYWLLGLWGIFRAPARMTRLQKENGIGRVLRASAGCVILLCGAVLGDFVLIITERQTRRECLGLLLLIFSALTALYCARSFRKQYRSLKISDSSPEPAAMP